MKKFKCKICGYSYENNILKEDFICPICGVDSTMFEEILEEHSRVLITEDNPCISRIEEKCVNCGICEKTCKDYVGIKYEDNLVPICIGCGACRLTCPRGAITEKYDYKIVDDFIKKTSKVVVALTSPAVRVSLGEEFGMEAGSFVEGKMVSALRNLGFNYVFDTTFGADLTTTEESHELLVRLREKKDLPMFSSCCPSWVRYLEAYHPTLINHLSTCKSPIAMQSILIKKYFSKIRKIEETDIVVVAITPCTSKKYEILKDGLHHCDYVLTTSELGLYLKEEDINFTSLQESEFDSIFGKGSSSAVMYGSSGGVTSSVIRIIYNTLTGDDFNDSNIVITNISDGITLKEVKINDLTLKIGIIYGLKNIENILYELEMSNKCQFDFIEVMNCNNGCIGGGGQPLTLDKTTIEKRKNCLKNVDVNSFQKYSYKNADIKNIYENFLIEPGSKISHELLHTTYKDRSYLTK